VVATKARQRVQIDPTMARPVGIMKAHPVVENIHRLSANSHTTASVAVQLNMVHLPRTTWLAFDCCFGAADIR
jgi:hypothetical protein